ncbi:MAG: RecQ family ATP-dependent DNA helicase [Xenococcus sp. MO_188.B8]|nr:RecQ family ATP-dependent DNA helicase [Xenococcus sp. MO_188.B8]
MSQEKREKELILMIQEQVSDLKAALQEIWGYSDFRYPQREIINSLLQKKDALIVMPTGGGKSLCFQLPALLQDGLTLVLSPLIALMENQVQQLQNKQLPAALIHSQQPRQERKFTLKAITNRNLRLLYLSPETLLSPPVWESLIQPQVKINGIILDEAHCLVQWGTTFRPAYTRLGAVRSTLSKIHSRKIAIAAFTATADPHTQQAITKTLKLYNPALFLLSPYRSNLHLEVKTIWTPKARRQQTLKFIQDKPQQSGLIYVRSRKDSEDLANWLQSQKLSTFPYHAGLPDSQRRQIENQWLQGEIPFVICTSAFGMGIDKSDCRWIVHYHTPELLAEYLQEIGRAGRDGKVAHTLALVSEPTGWLNPEDKQRSQFFTRQLEQKALQAKQIMRQIPAQGKIEQVIAEYSQGAIALSILHSLDRLSWQDPFSYRKKSAATSFNDWQTKQKHWQKQMQQFLHAKQCRWQFLLAAFGFREESSGFQCGKCDQCNR